MNIEEITKTIKDMKEHWDKIIDSKVCTKTIAIERNKILEQIKDLTKNFKNLGLEEKKTIGLKINELKTWLDQKPQNEEEKKPPKTKDYSYVADSENTGSIHILTHTINQLSNIMEKLGFSYVRTNQIELEENNFDHLNIPKGHPCRADHDTFFIKNGRVLRTQVTATEVFCLQNFSCPVAMYSVGPVFRNDNDATHLPMFHQLESMYTYEDASLPTLFFTIETLFREFFEEKEIEFRYRVNHFPFTEPSYEVDIKLENKWLEVLGCGMLHENVFKSCGSNIKKGFAFGMGVERLCMLKYKIKDLRSLYSRKKNIVRSMGINYFDHH